MSIPPVELQTGDELPAVGYGTWDISRDRLPDLIEVAIDAGYRHIDTAEGYRNEAAIGDVLDGYERDNLFLTSKVRPKNLRYDDVVESCRGSLDRLGTAYLDLLLIHCPNPTISLAETLRALADLHDDDLVRNVGVSNFDEYLLRCALHLSDVPIAVNQVEYQPYYQQPYLADFCAEHDVVLTASAPLGRAAPLDDEVIREVARKYDRSPAQVILRWLHQRGYVVLPRSESPENIRANIDIFGWELASEDCERIDEIPHEEKAYLFDPSDDWFGIGQ